MRLTRPAASKVWSSTMAGTARAIQSSRGRGPDQVADLRAVRAAFEATWNTVRTLTSRGSLLVLSWALAVSGRTTP